MTWQTETCQQENLGQREDFRARRMSSSGGSTLELWTPCVFCHHHNEPKTWPSYLSPSY